MVEQVFALELLRTSYALLILLLNGCQAVCPGRTFKNSEQCLACPLHCKYCNSTTYCFLCDDGYSGTICSQQCINCKPDSKCTMDTGVCEEACKEGLAGQYCNKACDSRCRSCIRNDPNKCITCKNGNVCEQVCPVDCYLHNCNKTCEPRCLHNCSEDVPSIDVCQVAVTVLSILLVLSLIVPLVMSVYKRKQRRKQGPILPSERYNVTTEEQRVSGGRFQDAAKVSETSETYKATSRINKFQDNTRQFSGSKGSACFSSRGNDDDSQPQCQFATQTAYTTISEKDNSQYQYKPITGIKSSTERSGEIKHVNTRGVEYQSDIASAYITPV